MKYCYLGTQTPYILGPERYIKPPRGYKPVYINHLGRHGARYLTSEEPLEVLLETLEDAAQKGQLTVEGFTLKRQIEVLKELDKGEYGLLTSSGVQMEQGIARRMYAHFPEVFGREVEAVSTYVERTKQSMDAFLEELAHYTSPQQFVATSNGKVDPILRFFDLNKAYIHYKKEGRWRQEVSQYAKRTDRARCVITPFFSEGYIRQIQDPLGVATALYKIYTNQYDTEQGVALGEYFTPCDMKYFWENSNLEAYLEKGPSQVGQNLPTEIAYPLLVDFLRTSWESLSEGNRSANLRFAHAETIIPFASLLGIKGAATQTNKWCQVSCLWKDYKVAPMAANIQWVFYQKEGCDKVLVKVLYNEREVLLPIKSNIKPYYRWADVSQFYTQKLEAMPIAWEQPLVEQVKDFVVL
ncbi:MAG: histidine-type phosphatase [Cellulosilyticaceae bacterium]